MTPDERLRNAVWQFLVASNGFEVVGSYVQKESISRAARAMCDAYHEANQAALAANSRPCINAAVEVERKPWWRVW